MAVTFHPLTIADVVRETPDAISISFNVPDDLRPMFLYKSGQYLTVRVVVNGVEHRRNYSLCSSPAHQEPLRIAVKRVHQGAVSQWLNEHAAPGMPLEVYPPMGNFTKELHPDNSRHYVMVAGGSGITPILSLLKSVLRIEQNSVVTLVYANRNEESIIFAAELARLAQTHPEILRVVYVLEEASAHGLEQFIGRMDEGVTRQVINSVVPSLELVEAFVCGPPGMMESVLSVFTSLGLAPERIHREYFTINKHPELTTASGMDSTATDLEELPGTDQIVPRTVTVRLYGDEHTFEVQPDETILLAAQRANLDPPYACQIGACCTCRAKIVRGRVKMDEREALSDDEIAEGYALTCQSHPLTDDVIADYDQ